MNLLDKIMLNWIRKKFMKKSEQNSANIMAKLKIPRKFEIYIEEMDEHEDGTIFWKPVINRSGLPIIITVSSPAEMNEIVNTYKNAGQRFKILREVDPPSEADIKKFAIEQGLIKSENAETVSVDAGGESDNNPINMPLISNDSNMELVSQNKPNIVINKTAPVQKQVINTKPKIVTIGDIQIKYDGDKIYQRQWVKLSSIEANQFRIVNSSSNKIISMNGKHIEAKRWVLVEDDHTSIEENQDIVLD